MAEGRWAGKITSFLAEPLGIGTMFESFHSEGSLPELMERLKMVEREGPISSAKVGNIQAVISS